MKTTSILKQLGIILGFGLAGEIASRVLPANMPASVLAMVLMLIALGLKLLKTETINPVGDFLSNNMAFLFLAPAVYIVRTWDIIHPILFKILGICIFSTFVTFFVTYGTVRLMQIILRKKS
jgi:holin-like protein